MTNDVRAELQKITREHPTQHLELVAELNERRPHSISLARDANGRPVHIVANCFEYAFGLTVFEEYENIRLCDFQERLDRFIANSMFMCHLLK